MDDTPTDLDAEARFAARQKRVCDAIELRQPDRVPVYLSWRFWPARQAGMTCEEAMYDAAGLSAATRQVVLEFQPDLYQLPHTNLSLGPALEAVDFKVLQWPGHGVDADVSYQYIDQELMTADEYDDYLFDPTGFILRTYLPRIAGAVEAFDRLPNFPSVFHTRLLSAARSFADPAVMAGLEKLAGVGALMETAVAESRAFADEMMDHGFPLFYVASATAPFDLIADYYRGSKGAMLDMFRHKDKLLAAMDKAAVYITESAIAGSANKYGNHVFIPLHWGLDGFMSPDQFETFFWPQLRRMILDLIDADLVPYVFWEGDCGMRLETIGDIPAGKAIYKFERTDLFRAKEILGDTVCLQGNVPPSMLNTGTPQEVDEYCAKLIEVVGKGGGFILDGGASIPDEAKRENVAAMVESVHKYGRRG